MENSTDSPLAHIRGVTLAEAREKRATTRKQRSSGQDPTQLKRNEKQAQVAAEVHTFEASAREWLRKTVADRALTTHKKNTAWLERNIFPDIGAMSASAVSSDWKILNVNEILALQVLDKHFAGAQARLCAKRPGH